MLKTFRVALPDLLLGKPGFLEIVVLFVFFFPRLVSWGYMGLLQGLLLGYCLTDQSERSESSDQPLLSDCCGGRRPSPSYI